MAVTLQIVAVNHDGGAQNDQFSVLINENIGSGTRVGKITGWEGLQGALTFSFHKIGNFTYNGGGRYVIEEVIIPPPAGSPAGTPPTKEYYLTVAPGMGGATNFDFDGDEPVHGEVWVDCFGPSSTTITQGEGVYDIYMNDLGNEPEPVPPTLSIAPLSAVKPEGNSGITQYTFTVTRSGDTSAASDVDWVIDVGTGGLTAEDFQSLTGTVHFNAGAPNATITVNVVGDTTVEGNEDFIVRLRNPRDAGISTTNGSAQGTIQDDDSTPPSAPSISIADATGSEGGNIAFVLTRTGDLSQASTVTWTLNHGSTAAGDFGTLPTNTVVFGAGQANATITLPVADDTLAEGNETFTIDLTAGANAVLGDGSATGTILANDAPSISIADATGSEGGNIAFVLTRTGDLSQASTVTWTLNHGSTAAGDFGTLPTNTVVFGAGQANATITLPVADDT
ncbi:Calx-beta domain-containing protein, partial [Microvirga subterranea]